MIQITLSFTSLEHAIAALRTIPENTLGVAEVNLKGNAGDEKPKAPAKQPKAEAGNAPPATTAPTPPTAEAAKPPAAAPAPKAEPPAPKGDEPLEYPVLQKAVFELAGRSRDAAAAINASFGVKTMKELPAEKRRAALEAVNAKLAELEMA